MNYSVIVTILSIFNIVTIFAFLLYDTIQTAKELKYWSQQKKIFELAEWPLKNIELVKNKSWIKETDNYSSIDYSKVTLKDFSNGISLTISKNP